jgi:TfoX/Sxy family transcriptional regulator of competence genes
MEIPKPSDSDRAYFRLLLNDLSTAEIKPMFGNLGAFVNGNMFAGLFGPAVGVRLDDADRLALQAIEEPSPFGPAGHAMSGYVGLPPSWHDDPELAAAWVARAFGFVASLPPKTSKPRRPRK